ncbi:RTA1 domain-containing protein [Aspergillus undulatus]|uniref:RTA1 domain-containing protein n=1 Tax=Aspergillus undulatus TaxID=1810928 RepID=UPI003CCD9DFB
MANGEPVLWSLYVYAPNKGAPIFFTLAYALSAGIHIWQCYRYKSFRLIGLYPLCGILFTLGYALREYGAYHYIYDEEDKGVLIAYVLSQVFIYICPPLLELSNYHILSRIFYYIPHVAPLSPRRVLSTFGALMALVEVLNALGVSLASNPSSSGSQQELGSRMSIAALAMQLIVIGIFGILAGMFQYRVWKTGRSRSARAIKIPLRTLYGSMTLIFVRCIYRLVEHTGHTSVDINDMDVLKSLTPILRYEWFFYVFEASLMLVNSVVWNIWHPGRYMPQSYLVHLGRDGAELVGVEGKDERTVLKKAVSVLSFGIFFRRSEPYRDLDGQGEHVDL